MRAAEDVRPYGGVLVPREAMRADVGIRPYDGVWELFEALRTAEEVRPYDGIYAKPETQTAGRDRPAVCVPILY